MLTLINFTYYIIRYLKTIKITYQSEKFMSQYFKYSLDMALKVDINTLADIIYTI